MQLKRSFISLYIATLTTVFGASACVGGLPTDEGAEGGKPPSPSTQATTTRTAGVSSAPGDLSGLPNVVALDAHGQRLTAGALSAQKAAKYAVFPEGCTGIGVPDPHHCDHFTVIRADGAPSRPARGGRGSFKEKPTNLLFLNFEGAALVSGNDDPVEGKSTVLSLQGVSQADMPAFDSADYYDLNDFSTREEQIHAVAGMVRRLFAPFDVEVVTERPSDAVPYSMVIVGGDVSLLNMPSGVLGVAPMDCEDSNPQNIPFVFASEMRATPPLTLTIAHEAGHSFGLVHIANEDAIMNPYQASSTAYWLEDSIADDLACDGANTQDSYAVLGDNLNWRVTDGDPWVQFVFPTDGAVLASLNNVLPLTADESIVEHLELLVDGNVMGSAEWPELAMTVSGVGEGTHTLELVATDHPDQNGETRTYSASIEVTVDPTCETSGSCSDGKKAVGQACTKASDCATGICVEEVATGVRVCSKSCSVESPCPWPVGLSQHAVQWTRCLCDEDDPNCCVAEPEDCGDGVDNDCDGRIDCADPDCEGGRMCTGMEVCDNTIDDDVDGLSDCADPDCALSTGCGCVAGVEDCQNGTDDNCNGLIDCADPACAGTGQCMSGGTQSVQYCGVGTEPVRVYSSGGGGSGSSGGRKLDGCRASGAGIPGSTTPIWVFLPLLGSALWGRKRRQLKR